jgi:hypothetical protein
MSPRLFLAALAALLGTACGGISHTVKEDYRLAEHPKQGLVLVSTRFSTDCKNGENPSAVLEYENLAYTHIRQDVIPVNDLHSPHDFQAPPGHFSVKALNAGPYQFRRLQIGYMTPITK